MDPWQIVSVGRGADRMRPGMKLYSGTRDASLTHFRNYCTFFAFKFPMAHRYIEEPGYDAYFTTLSKKVFVGRLVGNPRLLNIRYRWEDLVEMLGFADRKDANYGHIAHALCEARHRLPVEVDGWSDGRWGILLFEPQKFVRQIGSYELDYSDDPMGRPVAQKGLFALRPRRSR